MDITIYEMEYSDEELQQMEEELKQEQLESYFSGNY